MHKAVIFGMAIEADIAPYSVFARSLTRVSLRMVVFVLVKKVTPLYMGAAAPGSKFRRR